MVGNVYGLADASTSAAARRANEKLIAAAVLRAASFESTPYVLLGDPNRDPAKSPSIGSAIACEVAFDVCADRGLLGPTFSNAQGGIHQGSAGQGTSRIDAVLANRAGARLVTNVWYDWESSKGFDHVAIRLGT